VQCNDNHKFIINQESGTNYTIRMKKAFYIYLLLAIVDGLAIGYVDSQPNWDDTGVTVFLILIGTVIFSYLADKKPWLIALAVSGWIPIWAIVSTHNYEAFLALIPGFIGAYTGYFCKRAWTK